MYQQLFQFTALPEIVLLVMICGVLLVELFVKQEEATCTYLFAQLSLILTLGLVLSLHHIPSQTLFDQHFIWDPVSYLIRATVLFFSIFALVYARKALKDYALNPGEFYLLALFSVLGMLVLTAANSLLTLYLGLELLSFPLYALVALQRHSQYSAEAAMKYFILGALASGLFLYGLSLLYGATHALILSDIQHIILQGHLVSSQVFALALIFIAAGFAFKLGAAPFHFWVPDVYQGAATPVTLFISAAPKIAGLAMAIRLLINALPSLQSHWHPLLASVAILSFALGNLLAIVQTNLKRMLAYSAVAHIGYALLGFVAGTPFGYAMALFYVLIYGLMALGAFALLIVVSQPGKSIEEVNDLRGLNARSPWLAFLMLLIMFSMAGIPPMAGFFAKMGILQALIEAHQLWLATLAVVFAIIGSYYYLNVVKVMYFEEPEPTLSPIQVTKDAYLALSINAILLLVLGLFPSQLIWLTKATFLTITHPVY